MSRSSSTIIDLTEESPPAPLRLRRAPTSTGTHIFDWSHWPDRRQHSTTSATSDPSASSSTTSGTGRARERIVPGSSRPLPEPIVVASDDESDAEDHTFTIVGQSEPARISAPLYRSISAGTPASSSRPPQSTSGPSLRFHDSIGRGPHSQGSRIPQGFGILGSSPTARHPLLPQQRAAIPSTSTTTARRTSGFGANTASLVSRLGAEWPFTFTLDGMEMIGSILRGLHSNGPPSHPHSAERKVPQQYDSTWTHPHEVQPGFTHSIIEPPVDLDTYFDDKAIVTGPLPDTTPICAGCRHALVTGANEDQRIWVLPCGHVIDGRCIDRLSGIEKESAHGGDADGDVRGKGKAKAVDPPEDEPRSKSARTSARSRASTAATKPSTPKKAKKPKRFECPVQGCGQKCSKEPGGKFSAWAVFV